MVSMATRKSASTKRRAAPGDGTSEGDLAKAVLVTQSLLAKLPPLTAEDDEAFRSRFSDARCLRTGTETRSSGVLGDAVRWAPLLAKGVALGSDALAYDDARLAFFFGCVLALHAARQVERKRRGDVTVSAVALEIARGEAASARKALLDALARVAGGNEVDGEALDAVRGTTADDDAAVASLGAIADHAGAWLAKRDGVSKRLAASAKLTAAQVDAARAAAKKLAAAAAASALGGPAGTERDTPAINRIEGRVVEEMRVALSAFEGAAEIDERIPRLVPGPATRRVLVGRGKPASPGAGPLRVDGATPPAAGGGAAPALIGSRAAARRKPAAKKRGRR